MILPIVLYGHPALRKVAEHIESDYPDLNILIENMFETMYQAEGIGLAAPQIGRSIRLFVIDLSPLGEEDETFADFKKAFINAEIIERTGEEASIDEGCLSLPGIQESVTRKNTIRIKYMDENFVEHDETYSGYKSRVIQHEYDHIEGHTFVDRINPIRRQLIRGKLSSLIKGKVNCRYKVKTT